MKTLNPYLNFSGNTEEVFNFYKSVFGGEFDTVMRFSDTPDAEQLTPVQRNQIMHISLPIGDSVLMGTDAPEWMGFKLVNGNNVHISVTLDSKQEVDSIFAKLSEGGEVTMPVENMFWGDYFGSVTDKYGIQWMINTPSSNA